MAGLTSLRDIANLVKTVTNSFKFKNIGSSSARLTVEDGVTYRQVQNLLQSNNIPYNSWQPKEERSFRVVARGLHAETDKQYITDDLTALDHKVRNIHNAKSKTSGKKLNIFFIELEPAPNNKLIYDVKLINHQVVAFEPPNRREDIPRCYRCQEFGHTRSYCSKAVKCAISWNLMIPRMRPYAQLSAKINTIVLTAAQTTQLVIEVALLSWKLSTNGKIMLLLNQPRLNV
ncbi:hypothetical protein ACLKA6_016251 [Drosophila palustris]